ncbi:MAG: hypothetical protein K6B65_04020 [Bacilli bacterium]|nr:hypothetical protein [Bacilli bacterium]
MKKTLLVLSLFSCLALASCGGQSSSSEGALSSLESSFSQEASSSATSEDRIEVTSESVSSEESSSESISSEESSSAKEKDEAVKMAYKDPYEKDGNIEITLPSPSKLFERKSSEFTYDMAKFSYGLFAISCHGSDYEGTLDDAKPFFYSLGFEAVSSNEDMLKVPTSDSVGVLVAKKKLSNGQIAIALSLRSRDYEKEWANNLTLGASGDHKGFSDSADKVIAFLSSYISSQSDIAAGSNITLWVSGYSRGGSISTLIGKKIASNPSLLPVKVNADDFYVYTFEAPAAAEPSEAAYPFIHNIINRNDWIAGVMPKNYGLVRPGVDHYVEEFATLEQVNELGKTLTPNYEFLPFKEKELDYAQTNGTFFKDVEGSTLSGNEFFSTFMGMLTSPLPEKPSDGSSSSESSNNPYPDYDLHDRASWADHFESPLAYLIEFVFEAMESGKFSMDLLSENVGSIILPAMAIAAGQGNGLYMLLEALCSKVNYTFDADEVKPKCDVLGWTIANVLSNDPNAIGNIICLAGNANYAANNHYAETIWCYLSYAE